MREERARRWRCKIDDLVAFFGFSYIKFYSACFSFFVIVGCSALAYL